MSSATDEARRRAIDVNGIDLSILEAGEGDALVFVHGVVTTSNIFRNYLSRYSPKFRGVAVDLRGYGDSEKPATGFNLNQFPRDLIALADKLQFQRPVWVGVSMGGMILQRLATENPERVRALVLVSTTDQAMVLDNDPKTIGNPREYSEVSKGIIVNSFPKNTDPSVYQPLLDRIPTWNADVLREALTSMSNFSMRGKLSSISVPTLIMVGKQDDCATPEIAREILQQIRGSEVAEFETGHFMMAEDPASFSSVLGQFLRRLN
jgi:pimeloyl-ACP methyl ester carboxylesterase